MSPELFRANLVVLADRVQNLAKERHPEAETAYSIRGANLAMQVDFRIRAGHGEDVINIQYQQGEVMFSINF